MHLLGRIDVLGMIRLVPSGSYTAGRRCPCRGVSRQTSTIVCPSLSSSGPLPKHRLMHSAHRSFGGLRRETAYDIPSGPSQGLFVSSSKYASRKQDLPFQPMMFVVPLVSSRKRSTVIIPFHAPGLYFADATSWRLSVQVGVSNASFCLHDREADSIRSLSRWNPPPGGAWAGDVAPGQWPGILLPCCGLLLAEQTIRNTACCARNARECAESRVNEFFNRVPHLNQPLQLFVFGPERNASLPYAGDAALRNGWTPNVASRITQEVLSRFERLDFHAPPTGGPGALGLPPVAETSFLF